MMDRPGRLLCVAGLAVVAAFALWTYRQWPGEWAWTVDSINGTTVLTGPLAGGIAAAYQLNAHRVAPVSQASPRGWLVPLRSAASAWLLAVCVLLGTAVAAAVVTLMGPHGGPLEWWALTLGALTLAACTSTGSLAAWWVPQRAVVVAVPVLIFLTGSYGPPPIPDLFWQGPSSGSLAGLVWRPDVLVGRVLGLLALASCLVVSMLPWRERRGRAARVVAATVAGSALVASVANLERVGSDPWSASDELPSQCAGTAPAVCVSGSSVRHLVRTERALRGPATTLVEAGVVLPVRFDEDLPYRPGTPDHGVLEPVTIDVPSVREGASLLTRPAPCPQWTATEAPAEAVFGAEAALVEWLVARAGGRAEPLAPQMEQWLAEADSARAKDWVVHTYAALRSCDFDEIRPPWQG